MGTRLADLTTLRLLVQDDGTAVKRHPILNFIGAGVSVAEDVSNDRINVTIPGGGGGGGYDTIQEEGSPLAQESVIDFVGAGVTATPGTGKTVVTIPGGGAGFDVFNDLVNEDSFWWWYDQFFYPTPSSHFPHWETFGAVSTVAINIGGVVQITTTTAANNVTGFKVCAGGLTAVDSSKHVKLVWRVRPRNSQFNFACRIGFFNGQGSTPGGAFPYGNEDTDASQRAHCYFGFDDTGNWFTKTITVAGVSQKNFTTVVPTVAAFVNLEIEINRVPSTIEYRIDGVLEVTQTTDLPTGNLALGTSCQTGNTTARGFDIDTMFVVSDR